jgi:putative ABC transport system substrate-binding protein
MEKIFVAVVIFTAALGGVGAGPPQRSGIHRVAIVMEGRTSRVQPQVNGLRDGLEELKYVQGENLISELLEDESRETLRSKLASQIKRQKIDVIVTLGTVETAIAKELTQEIPIVFLPASDPVRSGFVRSLADPGTNLTGLTFYSGFENLSSGFGNLSKQLEVFKDVVPSLRNAFTIIDARHPMLIKTQNLTKLHSVAARFGVDLVELWVHSPAEATQKLATLPQQPKQAGVFVVCSGLFKELTMLASSAIKRRLPLSGCNAFQVAEQGVLLSYAPDLYSIGYRGAWYVNRIFSGTKPQTLPVETSTKFDMVINRKTATEIGLKIPHRMLMLADRVFD